MTYSDLKCDSMAAIQISKHENTLKSDSSIAAVPLTSDSSIAAVPLTKHQDLKILSWWKSDNSMVAVPQSRYPYMWISSDFCFVLSSGVAFSTYSSRPCAKFCGDQTDNPNNHGDLPEHDWACISFECESVRSSAEKRLPNLMQICSIQEQCWEKHAKFNANLFIQIWMSNKRNVVKHLPNLMCIC